MTEELSVLQFLPPTSEVNVDVTLLISAGLFLILHRFLPGYAGDLKSFFEFCSTFSGIVFVISPVAAGRSVVHAFIAVGLQLVLQGARKYFEEPS